MPANIGLPAVAKNYPSAQLNARPWDYDKAPPEGKQAVTANIAWGTDAQAGAVDINCQTMRNPISVIRALYVDNTQSGADVVFIFPDTQFSFTVPAGAADLFPVISHVPHFYAVSASAIAGDQTFLQIINCMPYPLAAYKSVFQSTAVSAAISLTATANTQLIPLGVNGTLQALSIAHFQVLGGAGVGFATIAIQDGEGTPLKIAFAGVSAPNAGVVAPALIYSETGLNVRFQNGLVAVITSTGTAFATGAALINAYYRQP